MGYQLQANAPQFKVGNETYALGCFEWSGGIVGAYWTIGLYRLTPDGWHVVYQYQPPSVLADMTEKGGRVAYWAWIRQLFNNWFTAAFPAAPPDDHEPATEEEARAMLQAFVNALTVSVTGGMPKV